MEKSDRRLVVDEFRIDMNKTYTREEFLFLWDCWVQARILPPDSVTQARETMRWAEDMPSGSLIHFVQDGDVAHPAAVINVFRE